MSGVSVLNGTTCQCNLGAGWDINPISTAGNQTCSCNNAFVDTGLRCMRCPNLIANCEYCQ